MTNDFNKHLTRPRSPTLHTTQRMKLKDDLSVASADHARSREYPLTDFKARPFNRRLFEEINRLPDKDKRSTTAFEEF